MASKLYIETYGCQMNFSDSEIVVSILKNHDFELVNDPKDATAIFINTCSIRDNAEKRVIKRLHNLNAYRKKRPDLIIGVLGCMAERVKESLFEEEKLGMRIDMIVGPDSYRDLPKLLESVEQGQKAINVILSNEETYADLMPVRYSSNNVSAFISIMRGCENFCSYCVVPYTRGKERSRDPKSIINEAKQLIDNGYREITLLGQNVNSYNWDNEIKFFHLLEKIASLSDLLRIRFATSHPKDLSNELVNVIAAYPNVCRSIHLPVQSGSNNILKKMNRKYTVESYLERIDYIKNKIPDCAISTDLITGFSGETEKDHNSTIDLMKKVKFDFAYMFKYSEREGTIAAKTFVDNVPENVKTERLEEIISLQQKFSKQSNEKDIGKVFEVLVEGHSKRSHKELMGRNSQNKVVIFGNNGKPPGEYLNVQIKECTSATLKGDVV